jgi:ABC-2 type transport system permease protein
VFLFIVLALSLFACAQVAAARHEESDEHLETLFALPVGRRRWLAGRLVTAAGAAAVLGLGAGFSAWAGARSGGARISLADMLGAGANTLPPTLLFGALAALAYAALPRAGGGIAYTVVAVAFLWQLVGSLLGAPHWIVKATPFAHVGLVPSQGFRAGAAAIMLAIALASALAALAVFRRRDLLGS